MKNVVPPSSVLFEFLFFMVRRWTRRLLSCGAVFASSEGVDEEFVD